MQYRFIVIPSKSEVFPLVYFEALRANVIPLVNDIDFFKLVSQEYNKHIFNMNDYKTIKKVLDWANNLEEDKYKDYIFKLKLKFLEYYKKNSKNIKDIILDQF